MIEQLDLFAFECNFEAAQLSAFGRRNRSLGAGNMIVSGTINNAGGLIKDGTGGLVLSAPNAYAGGTTVSHAPSGWRSPQRP